MSNTVRTEYLSIIIKAYSLGLSRRGQVYPPSFFVITPNLHSMHFYVKPQDGEKFISTHCLKKVLALRNL